VAASKVVLTLYCPHAVYRPDNGALFFCSSNDNIMCVRREEVSPGGPVLSFDFRATYLNYSIPSIKYVIFF